MSGARRAVVLGGVCWAACVAGALAGVEQFPDCIDGFIEPLRASATHGQYESTDGSSTLTHRWFCPGALAGTTRDVDFWKCAGDSVDRNCVRSDGTFDEFWRLRNMKDCAADAARTNSDNRLAACVPWRDGGEMPHLRRQFPWVQPDRGDEATVRPCGVQRDDAVEFSDVACWYDADDLVFLKPQYRFSFRTGGSRQVCAIATNAAPDAGAPSYRGAVLDYRRQEDGTRQWTNCKYMGKNSGDEWMKYLLPFQYMQLEDTWQTKKVQFYDYRLASGVVPCADSVTQSCFDNAFSFVGKACAWAAQSVLHGGLTLAGLLQKRTPSDAANVVGYGAGRFVLRFQARHLRVRVSPSGGRDDAADVVEWDGGALPLMLPARLHVSVRAPFSCGGCWGPENSGSRAFALAGAVSQAQCGVPQACVECAPSQYVFANGLRSPCDASFATRTCRECAKHHMRLSADELKCGACPELTPMRAEGAAQCAPCTVGQFFDATSLVGCANFQSVAQGLAFAGPALFSSAYVDEYKRAGSTDRPQAVPALHFRNTVSGGNAWNASTTARKCEASFFVHYNKSAERVFARNMYATEMQYRSWCGHGEIVRYDNAVVESVECVAASIELEAAARGLAPSQAALLRSVSAPGSRTSLRNLTLALSESLGSGYALAYEHRVAGNRVAEVRLTLGAATCFFEVRREGRTDNCRFCAGASYTRDCGPTYHPALDTPRAAGPGECALCETRCFATAHYFAVSQFSCWSNGTARVVSQGGDARDGLDLIAPTMTSMNHWYKPAECMPCAKVSAASVPAIVTRCGNKAWFEVWDASARVLVEQVARPSRRFCCAADRIANTASPAYDRELGSSCVASESDIGLLTLGGAPLCNAFVADLRTQHARFCPPGWFLDRKAPGCAGELGEWSNLCCSLCFDCRAQGMIKTDKYAVCPGDTDYDTQLLNCVTACAERSYQLNDTCYACESCA